MNVLKPTSLYLLFLIPLLLLLYVLKLRRKTHIVSSSLLWEHAIEDMKANTPFQRLRKNLLLPLQIIFLILAILALARPFWQGAASTTQNVILIIDGSASMKSTDTGESRFEAAKSVAAKMVDDLGDGDRMMIIEAVSSPRIVSDFTADKLQLQNTLDKMRPVDAPTDLDRAIQLASSLAKNMRSGEILLLSDGAGKNTLSAYSTGKPGHTDVPVRFIGFGEKTADNIGITALEIGQSLANSSERQVFITLQNFSSIEKQSLLVELYHNDNLIDVRELKLLPDERRSVIFDVPEYTEGIIECVIDVDDDLDMDNHVYYVATERDVLRVLLVSEGNQFLEEAVRTASLGAQVFKEKPETYSNDEEYDLIVFDGFVPNTLPDRNMILVDPGADLPFGQLVSHNDNPAVIDWDRSHPVMRFVDLSNLKVRRSYNYKMSPWMKPLVESDMGTLAWLGEHNSQRLIVLPFETRFRPSNNFPMLTAFPIFMSNALDWMAGVDTESSRRQVKPGDPLKLSLPSSAVDQIVMVRKPNGEEIKASAKDGMIVFNDTDMAGIYEIRGGDFVEKFAANLLDESESDIRPAEKIEIAGHEIASSAASAVSNREIWGGLIFVALILLAVEWWVYHRRVLV